MKSIKHIIFKIRVLLYAFKFLIFQFYNYFTYRKKQSSFAQSQSQSQSIVHINTHDGKGGAARIAFDLIYGLKNSYKKIDFFVGEKKTQLSFVNEFPTSNLREEEFLNEAHKRSQWLDIFFPRSTNKALIKRLNEFDIIHLHNLHGNFFSLFALLLLKPNLKIVWTLHDMQAITGHCAHAFSCDRWQNGCGNCPDLLTYPSIKKDTTKFLWRLKSNIYKKLDLEIIVPSIWLKEKVEKSILKQFPIKVIYNGVDTKIFKPLDKFSVREELDLPQDKKIIMFSADMGLKNPYKGGEYVKDIIKDDLFKDVLFINLGGEEFVKSQNCWTYPYIHNQEDLVRFYNAADVLLYPSLADNCPLVVLEAMACGLPIVTFNIGGIPELVLNAENGYVVSVKNFLELKSSLLNILLNEDLRKEFSLACIKRVNAYFTLEIMNLKYLNLYKNVI